MRIAAVVLAAGASRRLGELKQLVWLNEETLLDRVVRVCGEAGCAPIVVVLGAFADVVREQCTLQGATAVVNCNWTEGMGSSVRAGVEALSSDVAGCVIVTCDMPQVTAAHLQELLRTGELSASEYAGRRGVPAYFPAAMFSELMQLHGDAGARTLLKGARAVLLQDGEIDVDTPDDLRRVRELFS